MGFRNKKAKASLGKAIKTGLFVTTTQDEKKENIPQSKEYHRFYSLDTRQRENDATNDNSSLPNRCITAPFSPNHNLSNVTVPPSVSTRERTPSPTSTPSTRHGLRSDNSKKVGRPSILDEPLTEVEQRGRKRLRYEESKQKERTREARSQASIRRWHPELFQDSTDEQVEESGEGRGGGGDGVGDAETSNEVHEIEVEGRGGDEGLGGGGGVGPGGEGGGK